MERILKESENLLKEVGQTYLIEKEEVINCVNNSKGSPRKLKTFLYEQSQINRQTISGTDYIRVPQTFATEAILGWFGI